jgi:nucleoside-diphosphate-sugar epimerase
MSDFDVVTGAFSYSGAAIARELQAAGRPVRTLTGHPSRAPEGTAIEARPLDFADPAGLRESLRGARTLYNTYWVRFAHGQVSHEVAVANSRALFLAAAEAGVRRIVHVSITHPSADSPYPYFRGKAAVEQALADLGVSHAVLRPSTLFGGSGVLINNIAWLLRHLPVFAVGGTGTYRLRPIHVDDLARLCVRAGLDGDTAVIDAVGPDRPTFLGLVTCIRDAVGSRSQVIRVPGSLIPPAARLLGAALRDTLLTADEYLAMAEGLADTDGPATGQTSLTEWIIEHKDTLGRSYANELTRHFRSGRKSKDQFLPNGRGCTGAAGLDLAEGPGVGGGVDLAELVHRDQRVDLGGRHGCVAEQFLDHPDVGAAVEQVRGERVPQRVR